MILEASNLSKKYYRDWVIRDFNFTFESGNIYAVKGPNGSGKSSLLKLLCGLLIPSKGNVRWEKDGLEITAEDQFKYFSISAPYLQLIEELTLDEFLSFHHQFKSYKQDENANSFKTKSGLISQGTKQIKDFSSGMKQRVKLGLSFYFENEVILIDEGSTNLDAQGLEWFKEEVLNLEDKLVILFSNQKEEYSLTKNHIELDFF